MLVQSPTFRDSPINFDIHARTTIRYEYSFIEAVALRIGNEVLEVASWGDYALNGVDTPNLEEGGANTIAGYPIHHTEVNEKKHIFEVVLSPTESITISTFKDMVTIEMDGNQGHMLSSNSTGIMGTLDGKMLGRDGETDMSGNPNELGQEWQVRSDEPMLFRVAREPQFPQQCILRSAKTVEARRLGQTMPLEKAEEACAQHSGVYFDNCVYDVMATGDVEAAEL